MIRFTNVQGEVLIDDRIKDDRRMAYAGLSLDPRFDYLVATTQSSSAEVHAFGKSIRLGTHSFLRVGALRNMEGKHNEFWMAQQTRQFLQKIWLLAGGRA